MSPSVAVAWAPLPNANAAALVTLASLPNAIPASAVTLEL